EYIADCKKCGAKTMFATHYHELTELEDRIPNIKNYCVAVKKSGDEITFLRKIIRGGADESYGVEVAALAGVKGGVIKRAKEVAKILESRDKKTVDTVKINTITAKPVKKNDDQYDFLAVADNEIIAELKAMDLNNMTPALAIATLYDLQAKARLN
ncbi:MAG: DNA mismatch repair protein MutS, partial [Oscillospiraceae bacterium]